MTENVLVLGANSAIAKALCHRMAARGARLILTGRNQPELERTASDLRLRYETDVFVEGFDAVEFAEHSAFLDRCLRHAEGELTGAVLCFGNLPEQDATETDWEETRRAVEINFLAPVSLMNRLAQHFEGLQSGYLAAISSVAGDRGRQSNYTYGAAKAAMSVYLDGLRNRLFRAGVHVLTVKPGFVDTPMTWGLLNPHSPLVASPERVARTIDRAIRKRRNVLYTPWFWRPIMCLITALPEYLFKRMKL